MKILPIPLWLLLAAGAYCSPGLGQAGASRPDVFLITIDTLRADHVHCYGYNRIRTPALDQLAKQGIRFRQAFTPSPITNTSHASILTGLQPSSHGVSDFGIPLEAKHPSVAELLVKQGYRTAAFIGSVILDSKTLAPGFDHGFEFYDNFPEHSRTKSRWGRLERRGMEVVQHAETWLSTHGGKPYFVWLHLYDPHDPYEPPPPYSEIYKDRLYDGEIAYADAALGHFIEYLKQNGRYDEALIILVGDHGEGLGDHHEDTHGIFLYDSTIHVPLLVKLPNGREAGTVVETQVRTTDIMPTILDLAGIPAPPNLDGDSLRPLLTETETAPRTLFGETDYPLRFGWAPLRCVRKDGFKFIEAPRPELYDLSSDQGELHNNYVPWDSTVQKLRKELAKLSAKSPSQKTSPGAVRTGTIAELHALGYLDSADARSSTDVPEPSLLPDPKDKIEEQNLLHTAMMASENGELAKARVAFEKILQLEDTSVIALSHLGQFEMNLGNYTKAAGYLRRARDARPDDAIVVFDYGRALELGGDLTGARGALQESLKLNPHQFAARLSLGQVYLRLDDSKAAEDQFEAAVLLQPGSEEAQIDLAKALIRERKFTEVVELLAGSSSRNPEMFVLLAQGYAGLGRREDAQRAESRAKALQKRKSR